MAYAIPLYVCSRVNRRSMFWYLISRRVLQILCIYIWALVYSRYLWALFTTRHFTWQLFNWHASVSKNLTCSTVHLPLQKYFKGYNWMASNPNFSSYVFFSTYLQHSLLWYLALLILLSMNGLFLSASVFLIYVHLQRIIYLSSWTSSFLTLRLGPRLFFQMDLKHRSIEDIEFFDT